MRYPALQSERWGRERCTKRDEEKVCREVKGGAGGAGLGNGGPE